MAKDEKAEERAASKRVGALRGLAPFLRPYRAMTALALGALVITAGMSLILPLAVRRVVDGFNQDVAILDQYFGAALLIAALLAIGTGVRYYFVTKLGERVVADIRRAVFDRVMGMSPAFFERLLTGEVLSRITTDTTLILSLIGSSISVALRNVLMLLGGLALLFLTSGKLTGLVLLIVPAVVVPIVVLGRRLRGLSREAQDWIANSSGSASEALSSVQTVQAFTHEGLTKAAFAEVTEKSFDVAKVRTRVRAVMTVIVIFLTFTGIVGVLWIGARDVRAGVMSPGELVQFVIYAVMVAGAVGALSEIWGEVQRAAGATERLVELLNAEDSVVDAAGPKLLPRPVRGEIVFDDVTFRYPARPEVSALNGVSLTVNQVQDGPQGCEISINLIPHTVQNTALHTLAAQIIGGTRQRSCAKCKQAFAHIRRAEQREYFRVELFDDGWRCFRRARRIWISSRPSQTRSTRCWSARHRGAARTSWPAPWRRNCRLVCRVNSLWTTGRGLAETWALKPRHAQPPMVTRCGLHTPRPW